MLTLKIETDMSISFSFHSIRVSVWNPRWAINNNKNTYADKVINLNFLEKEM